MPNVHIIPDSKATPDRDFRNDPDNEAAKAAAHQGAAGLLSAIRALNEALEKGAIKAPAYDLGTTLTGLPAPSDPIFLDDYVGNKEARIAIVFGFGNKDNLYIPVTPDNVKKVIAAFQKATNAVAAEKPEAAILIASVLPAPSPTYISIAAQKVLSTQLKEFRAPSR